MKPQPPKSAPRPIAAQQRPLVVIQHAPERKSRAISSGWIILILGLLLSMVPGLGFSMYLLALFFAVPGGILGIVGAAQGKPFSGIILILSAFAAFWIYLAMPWVSVAVAAMLSTPPQ